MSLSANIAAILENAKKLDELTIELHEVCEQINELRQKLLSGSELELDSVSRLAMLYTRGKELSETEVSVSTQLLGQIDTLIPAETQGRRQRRIGNGRKRRRVKAKSGISRLHPPQDLESLADLKDEQVAARIFLEDGEQNEWFVVKVICFDKETKEFEVVDEEPDDDDDESNGPRKYKLPWSNVIPFPKQTDPSSAPDFPPGEHVLAVYPGTTALYRATVVQARKRKTDNYVLEFDDDEKDGSLPRKIVPFNRVVPLPEGNHQ